MKRKLSKYRKYKLSPKTSETEVGYNMLIYKLLIKLENKTFLNDFCLNGNGPTCVIVSLFKRNWVERF